MTIEDNEKAIFLLHKYGIKVKGFFILNLPGATKSSVEKTLLWAKNWVEYADFYPLVAFPGTSLWQYPDKLGMNILSRDFGFWEAAKDIGELNVENPNVPNDYIKNLITEVKQEWARL